MLQEPPRQPLRAKSWVCRDACDADGLAPTKGDGRGGENTSNDPVFKQGPFMGKIKERFREEDRCRSLKIEFKNFAEQAQKCSCLALCYWSDFSRHTPSHSLRATDAGHFDPNIHRLFTR